MKTNILKLSLTISLAIIFFHSSCLFVQAVTVNREQLLQSTVKKEEIEDKLNQGTAAGLEQLKQTTENIINKALAQLDALESNISSNSNLEGSTKQLLIGELEKVEAQLKQYQKQLAAATTLAEVRQINQEVVAYLKENKDLIRQNVQQVAVALGVEAIEEATQLIKEVEALLQVLKITCPSQKEAIVQVETQLESLENELAKLESAVQAKDTSLIKQELTKIAQMTEEILSQLEAIESQCGN